MATVIVLFNLKAGIDPAAYERWARERDAPTVNGLDSVDGFRELKATGLLGTDAAPPYQYVEVLEYQGLDALGADIATERMQEVARAFGEFVARVPAPLCIGSLELEDGARVSGFLCEPHALGGAREISSFGGWRAFRKSFT